LQAVTAAVVAAAVVAAAAALALRPSTEGTSVKTLPVDVADAAAMEQATYDAATIAREARSSNKRR